MLRDIARSGARAPTVLAEGGGLLALEWLEHDGDFASAWLDIASQLALLHGLPGDAYGYDRDHAFGAVTIDNRTAGDWPTFWRERRVLPLSTSLPAPERAAVERACRLLDDVLPSSPPASLLHGDCWTGNLLVAGGRLSGFIDPACYYGEAAVDLAMLSLFASPPEAFWSAFEPVSKERIAAYQLWPILVHVRLFGASYLPMLRARLSLLGSPVSSWRSTIS